MIEHVRRNHILLNHEQRGVRKLHDALHVGGDGHGRRIDDDKIKALLCLPDQGCHAIGTAYIGRLVNASALQQQEQLGVLHLHHSAVHGRSAACHIQGTGALPGVFQYLMAGRFSHVAVQKKHALLLLRHGQGQIHGNGGFPFVFHDAGHHQHAAVGRHLLLHAPAQLADGLHIQQAAGRVGDQYTGLAPLNGRSERLVFPLMDNFIQHAAVELLFSLLLAAYHVPPVGKIRQEADHGGRGQYHRFFHVGKRGPAVIRRNGHLWGLQNLQYRFSQHLIGDELVVFDHGLRYQKRGARIRGRDLHGQQVRLRHGGRADGSVKGGHAQLLQYGAFEQRTVEHLGKDRGKAACSG